MASTNGNAAAMSVIDADSHFMEPLDWFEKSYPKLHEQLPKIPRNEYFAQVFLEAKLGDLYASLPPQMRPSFNDIFGDLTANASKIDPNQFSVFGSAVSCEGAARADWARQHGIDIQIMVPTLGSMPYRTAMRAGQPELAINALGAYNTWATEHVAGYTDRLIPVCLVDLSNLEWALAELHRMRKAGSRVVQVKGEPAAGKSLAHPDFDRFWATAEDLGMMIMFHVGGGRGPAPNAGWLNDGGGVLDFIAAYGGLSEPMMPQWALASLIKKGVLERHPKLGVIVSELGVHWVPGFAEWLDSSQSLGYLPSVQSSRSRLSLKPSEYMRRQVRVSVVQAADRVRPSLDHAPEGVIVFASDFPHPEGAENATEIFDKRLGDADARTRERFYGGAMAELLELGR